MTAWRGDMADVAEICGDAVARELCEKLPGILFYVPKRIRDKGQIGLLSDISQVTLCCEALTRFCGRFKR
jgi:hypothetical protein